MKLNFSYGLLGIRLLDHVFPGAGEMGFPVISEMLLISIISFQFPASASIFMNAVVVSLSPGFLLCKGMAVLSDTKHQAMPYSAKTFLEKRGCEVTVIEDPTPIPQSGVIVKSPGISLYRHDIKMAKYYGAFFTTGVNLFMEAAS